MSTNKQFGVWMDNHQATIVGNDNNDTEILSLIAKVKGENSADGKGRNGNNNEKNSQSKFFKEIASHMVNATHVHVTGTGQAQEQFINYLASTPGFKNSKTAESTSNKMSDDKLVEFITGKF